MGKNIIDFEQLIGSTSLRNIPANWFYANIADARDDNAQNLARYFIDFHKNLIEKQNLEGMLEYSASSANERALEIARDLTGKDKVLCSNLTHSSVEKAIHKLGLKPIIVYAIPDNNFQISDEELYKKVKGNEKNIAAIISTHGTTNLGHIETLATNESVQELRENGALLHIDAAYGGLFTAFSGLYKIPDADMITLDQYKFIGIPGTALLLGKKELFKDKKVSYFNQSQLTEHTTLSAGPIMAWYKTQEELGPFSLKEIANDCIKITRDIARELKNNRINLIINPQISTVPIMLSSEEEVEYIRNKLMEGGYKLGRIKISGDKYDVNGLRMSITPKVRPEYQLHPALQVAKYIAKLKSQ